MNERFERLGPAFAWLVYPIAGNALGRWLIALLVVVISYGLVRLIVARLGAALEKLSKHTTTKIGDIFASAVKSTKALPCLGLALFLGSLVLELPTTARVFTQAIAAVILVIQLGLWTQAVLMGSLGVWTAKNAGVSNRTTLASGLGIAARFVLWSVVVLVVLSNMGVRVDALVAGLGIGGVAAALAVQNLLGDVIASVSIFVDRPFDLGDFIVVETYEGTVEHIGWRSTQLKSISGEQLILPNSDLMRSRIRNFKRMEERRVELILGLSYNTSADDVEHAPGLIREAIASVDGVRFDRAHFKGFGTTALEFVAVWFIDTADYAVFMNKQQQVNLGILRRFRDLGLVFSRPLEAVGAPGEAAGDNDAGDPAGT